MKQTYLYSIIEWVIVEGSQSRKDAEESCRNLSGFIAEIQPNSHFNIVYIEYSGHKLGGLRNLGNENCNGDIIVCMDDDDYYPPTRVEEVVTKLHRPKRKMRQNAVITYMVNL